MLEARTKGPQKTASTPWTPGGGGGGGGGGGPAGPPRTRRREHGGVLGVSECGGHTKCLSPRNKLAELWEYCGRYSATQPDVVLLQTPSTQLPSRPEKEHTHPSLHTPLHTKTHLRSVKEEAAGRGGGEGGGAEVTVAAHKSVSAVRATVIERGEEGPCRDLNGGSNCTRKANESGSSMRGLKQDSAQ